MSVRFHADDGIAVLLLERADHAPNVIDDACVDALAAALERLAGDDGLRGAVLTSTGEDFAVGAERDTLYGLAGPGEALARVRRFHAALRRLETLGKPVVAAVGGRALGGGLELALACHARLATRGPGTRLALPEIRLGLMPGGGGTQRLPRMIGVQPALEWMLDGRARDADSAHAIGLIDELVDAPADLVPRARVRIEAGLDARRPWDRSGFAWPGGDPRAPEARQAWMAAPSALQRRGLAGLPAARDLLSAVYEGSRVGIDAGCRIESRYFAHCATGRAARNTLRVLGYELNRVRRAEARPAGVDPRAFTTLGVLGAGLMGAGIAHVAARAGLEVRVKDVDRAHAERAVEHARRQLGGDLERGRLTREEHDRVLARIQPVADDAALAGAELVVEAVDEDRALKERVLAAAEAVLGDDTVVASNTSTLPIGSLAPACRHRERFLGLHFFSPVERMPLVEIIRGPETQATTLAHAFDFARRIGKTPIGVNDGRGFFTSRVFAAYVLEGAAMVAEGLPPPLIERAATAQGMPIGPLALSDEVGLGLILRILDQARADGEGPAEAHPGEAVLRALVERHDRPGRRSGAGFYARDDGERRLWPGLAEAFAAPESPATAADAWERLLRTQQNEALRAYAEGIVERAGDADVASVLGWGFPAAAGGVLGSIDELGATAFVERLEALAWVHGARFEPPELARRLAAAGTTVA